MTDQLSEIFNQSCRLATPLEIANDLLHGLARIAETMEEVQDGSTIQRMAWIAMDQIKVADEVYGKLFRLSHPKRDSFEEAGWPGDAPNGIGGAE